jgi:hypothetical protein
MPGAGWAYYVSSMSDASCIHADSRKILILWVSTTFTDAEDEMTTGMQNLTEYL